MLPAMRFSWFVTAGVCAWLVACGSSSHKKALTCDPAECGPDAAGATNAAAGSTAGPGPEPESTAGQGGEGGSTASVPPDTGASEGGSTASDGGSGGQGGEPSVGVNLELVLVGDGTVAVGQASACLASPCSYPASAGAVFSLEARPGASSRFVGWSGDCHGSAASTAITLDGSARCVATFVARHAVALAVSAEGGGSVASTPNLNCGASGCQGEVDDHSQVTISAAKASGYLFAGWTGSSSCDGVTQASLNLDVTADVSCVAHFSKQYVLTIAAHGADAPVAVSTGSCSAILCAAEAGAGASFSASPLAGFRFSGWSGSPACTGTSNPLLIAAVTSDVSCVAEYAAQRSVIGLVGSSGSGSVVASSGDVNARCNGNSCTLDSGTTATLLAPTVIGKRLTGWSGAGCLAANQSGNGITVTPTTTDITCTANYATGVSVTGTVVGATGTVTASSTSSGASCSPGSCSLDQGGSVALTAPNLLPTYRFSSWSGDMGCAGTALAITLSNVQSSTACKANYVQQFTIASLATAGGSANAKNGATLCAGSSCTVDAGTLVTLTAVPDAANGYHFTTWTGAGCTTTTNPLTLSNVNATCTASFALNTFTIAATSGTNGSVTATRADTNAQCVGASCTVNFGVNVSLAALPAANFHFAGWSGAGCTPAGSSPLVLKNLNATCAAAFAIDTFSASVTASPPAGGVVGITCPAGNCGAVPAGQLANITASANAGWSFQGWSANCGGGTASPSAVTVTTNTSCVATFRPRATALASPSGAGSIAPSGTPNAVCSAAGDPANCVVDLGGSVTFTARPLNNAVFVNWSGDCSGTAATVTLTGISAPKNCTANFYQLWAQATGADGVDGLTKVATLADGTVVGLGQSALNGSKLNRLTLVDLNANTGKLTRGQVFEDKAATGSFAALGLTTTSSQKNVIALGAHAVLNGRVSTIQPWLHSEQTPAFESEYAYSNGGNTSGVGGEVITTLDGGYAFTVGVNDPQVAVIMTHLTRVDTSGKPSFDVQFCATDPKGTCLATVPVDLIQDAKTKNYVVLSRVTNTTTEILLTFVDETGAILGTTRYLDRQDLVGTQLAQGSAADTYLVVGRWTDPKGSISAFFAELTRAAKVPSLAIAVGAGANNEQFTGIAKTATGYALSGAFTDAQLGNEAWLTLIDASGGIKTQVAFGGPLGDGATSIGNVPSGGFALGGLTSSWGAGNSDLWTLRVDSDAGLTFNAASGATRHVTSFSSAAITSITSPASTVTKRDSTATQVTPAVTTSVAGFTQVAQAP